MCGNPFIMTADLELDHTVSHYNLESGRGIAAGCIYRKDHMFLSHFTIPKHQNTNLYLIRRIYQSFDAPSQESRYLFKSLSYRIIISCTLHQPTSINIGGPPTRQFENLWLRICGFARLRPHRTRYRRETLHTMVSAADCCALVAR